MGAASSRKGLFHLPQPTIEGYSTIGSRCSGALSMLFARQQGYTAGSRQLAGGVTNPLALFSDGYFRPSLSF